MAHETQRVALYRGTVALVRAYANISDELGRAGYSDADIKRINSDLDRYLKLREIIRNAADEKLDMKAYEADMRHLIDTYIEADAPRKISPFDDMPLLDLIVKTGIAAAINNLPGGLKNNKIAAAETIENNVRSKIIKEHLNDPAFYEKMSALLDEIIKFRKEKADEYEESLKRIAELAKQVQTGHAAEIPEPLKKSPALRALYNNLNTGVKKPEIAEMVSYPPAEYASAVDPALVLALRIDETVKHVRPDGWRGVQAKENVIKSALYGVLQDVNEVERIFSVIEAHKGEY